MNIQIDPFEINNRPQMMRFAELPFAIYKDNPNFIPRFRMEYLGNRLLGAVGLFEERFPYHHEAKSKFFIAKRDGQDVGSIMATVNHRYNRYHNTQLGAFGFFECINDQAVANELLSQAEQWCQKEGANDFMGPFNYSTNQTCGLLIGDGCHQPPVIEMPYNPAYYQNLLEGYGLIKRKDLISLKLDVEGHEAELQRFQNIAERATKRLNIKLRPINTKKLKEEVRLFVDLYNEAWANNWGFVPVSVAEADLYADNLKMILEPSLFLFAEVDGIAVACIGAVPDLNQALRIRPGEMPGDLKRIGRFLWRKSKINGARLIFYGVREAYRKRGVDSLLFAECLRGGQKLGFSWGDIGWILEDNHLTLRAATSMGAKPYRTYRIYGTSSSGQV